MTLYQVINTIKDAFLAQPNINSVVDAFDDLNREDAKYSAAIVQQDVHAQTEDWIQYVFYLGYADRLLPDESNEIEVQSTAINVIKSTIKTLEAAGCYVEANQYTPFTRRFTAQCAGAYARFVFYTQEDDCVEFRIPGGAKIQPTVDVRLTENGSYSVRPFGDYDAIEGVNIDVEVPAAYPGYEYGLKFAYSTMRQPPYDLDYSRMTDGENMFTNCPNLNSVDFTQMKNIPAWRNIQSAFYGCRALNSVTGLDVSSLEACAGAFYNCTNLTNLTFKGTFGAEVDGISFTNCPLTVDSIISALTAAAYGEMLHYTRSMGFRATTVSTDPRWPQIEELIAMATANHWRITGLA